MATDRYHSAFALFAACILCGCVSTKIVPVDRTVLSGFHGGSVTLSHREKPSFSAGTAGKATFALIGAAAMISAGNAIVRDNDIADPAVYIGQTLAADLATDNALTPVDSTYATDTRDVSQLAKQYASANLLLDVETINWSFIYFPTNWTHYRVIYSAKLRLIDTRQAKLIADGFCSRVPEEMPDAPTHDELLRNNAARLKQELKIAADRCVSEFRSKVLQKS